jgi:hypothetical protein
MLSITHHTRKRPSTGPRTTHGPQRQVGAESRFFVQLDGFDQWSHLPGEHGRHPRQPRRHLLWLDAGNICRMDLPGPTTSVGISTDYSVGPWDYLTCATRYLLA